MTDSLSPLGVIVILPVKLTKETRLKKSETSVDFCLAESQQNTHLWPLEMNIIRWMLNSDKKVTN